MNGIARIVTAFILLFGLASCDTPRGAALQSEVVNEKDADFPSFQVVEVTRANMVSVSKWPAAGWHGHYHWLGTSTGSSVPSIRTGDKLNVTIWDSQENSLITSTGQKFTQLNGVTVEGDGSIFLPYVNRVSVRGLTVQTARARIQSRLEPIVPSAQVQLSLEQGRNNSVDVVSGVAAPGSYPLPSRNYKILNLLSDAGGIPESLRNPRVRLLRGASTYEIAAEELYANNSKNVRLQPQDTVLVEQDERSFVGIGAAGAESLIYFPKDHLTAMEALALMSGLNDTRADPKGVLVLREYDPKHLSPTGQGPNLQQVVFTFDLTSADGLFAARQFEVNPNDTVLATESPALRFQSIAQLIGSAIGLTTQVTSTISQ